MLYFHATGAGGAEASRQASPSGRRPAVRGRLHPLRTWHPVTWSNYNSVTPGNSNEMRLRSFEFTTAYPTKIGTNFRGKASVHCGVKYQITLVRKGSNAHREREGHERRPDRDVSWSDTKIGQPDSGYFGIRHQPGREARYEKLADHAP